MENTEFAEIRHMLGKTQGELANALCVSTKAVQSFEQGWRRIPTHVEREMLLLLSLKNAPDTNKQPCWEIRNCPDEWKKHCIVWELQARNHCWFFNGTYCMGERHKSWDEKILICRECQAYKDMFKKQPQTS